MAKTCELVTAPTLLTTREHAVSDLIVQGRTDKEIADELHIARGTVRTYVGRIFRKLHVANRARLAALIAGVGRDDRERTDDRSTSISVVDTKED